MKKVSMIIPNYNGKHLLAENLPTVLDAASAYSGTSEILVVDDGSTDESVQFLGENFSSVRVLPLPVNQGFGKAVNAGVREATHEIVLLLNNDVSVDKGFIAPLTRHFIDKEVFSVVARGLIPEQNMANESLLKVYFRNGFIERVSPCTENPDAQFNDPCTVLYACAGFAAYDRIKFLDLGGMDDLFSPFFWEDVDISYRAWKKGWWVLYEPESIVHHQWHGTIARTHEHSYSQMIYMRNQLLFIWKNISDDDLLAEHATALNSFIKSNSGPHREGCFEAIKMLPEIFKRTREGEAGRVYSDREIFALSGNLVIPEVQSCQKPASNASWTLEKVGQNKLESERDRLFTEYTRLLSHRDALLKENDSLKNKCQRLIAERDKLRVESQRLIRLLDSWSWKITFPLRFMRRIVLSLYKRDPFILFPQPSIGTLGNSKKTKPLILPYRQQRSPEFSSSLKISVVTPSYNQGRFIENTIKSVLDQSYPNLEYIIMDGGSTDGTREVIERYQHRLAHWESQKDKGQANALNLGFQTSSGEIMAYLNSDDLFLPGAMHYAARYLMNHPEVDAVYGHRILINETGDEIGRWILPPHDDHVLRIEGYIPQETFFWRRRIWEKVEGNFDENYHFAMDWELMVRFIEKGAKIVRLPVFLGAFRVHENQKTTIALEPNEEVKIIRSKYFGHPPSEEEVWDHIKYYRLKAVILEILWKFGLIHYD